MKTCFKLAMLCLMVILYNCENDDLSQNAALNTMSEQIAKVKKITFTELQSKQSLQKTLQNLSKKLDVNKSKISASKNGVDSNDGSFTILTDNIRETKTDSTLTYTFQLETPTLSTSSFENFVIERQIDSTYNFYIYHFESNSNGDDFPYNLTTSAVDESLVAISSFSNVLGKTTTCGGGGISYQDVYGMHCDCCGGGCSTHAPYWTLIGLEPIWNWGDTCGGASDGGDYGEPNWSSGNNNGTPNSGTSLGSPSSPAAIIPPTMAQQLGLFIMLTEEQKFWANKQEQELIAKFTTFLLTNCGQDYNSSICQEAESFVFEAIQAVREGGKFDHVNKVILDSTFVAIQKVNCTYNQISKNINFKTLIENFRGEESPNLTFKIAQNLQCNNSNDANGCTRSSLNTNSSITIEIDEDYINSNETPTLLIANTIIHEAIHANLYLSVYNHENGNPVNIPDIDDFPAIYEKYIDINNSQHDVMADFYVNFIAQILQEIHPHLNDQQYIDSLTDFDFSLEQFYICLAYTGLHDTLGQSMFLNNPENYNSSYYDVRINSTKEPHCE